MIKKILFIAVASSLLLIISCVSERGVDSEISSDGSDKSLDNIDLNSDASLDGSVGGVNNERKRKCYIKLICHSYGAQNFVISYHQLTSMRIEIAKGAPIPKIYDLRKLYYERFREFDMRCNKLRAQHIETVPYDPPLQRMKPWRQDPKHVWVTSKSYCAFADEDDNNQTH